MLRSAVVKEACITKKAKGLSFFEKYLTFWVALGIVAGVALGKLEPGIAGAFDGMAICGLAKLPKLSFKN